MLPDYVQEHRDKLMADPVRYITLLRKQNVLHCVWHLELQQKIAELEARIEELRRGNV